MQTMMKWFTQTLMNVLARHSLDMIMQSALMMLVSTLFVLSPSYTDLKMHQNEYETIHSGGYVGSSLTYPNPLHVLYYLYIIMMCL